jgi:hypothetical protein
VFKLSLVLQNSVLEYRPTVPELTQMVNEVSRELTTVVAVVPRLEDQLPLQIRGYNVRTNISALLLRPAVLNSSYVLQATDAAISSLVIAATSGLGAVRMGVDDGKDDEDAPVLAPGAPALPTFFDMISNDMAILTQQTDIMNGVSSSTSGLFKRKTEFEKYNRLWETDKSSFMRRYAKDNRPLVQV